MAEDADFARILPPPPSAAGWPSPYPFHSYVRQTELSSNKQSTGICPLNQKDLGRLDMLSTHPDLFQCFEVFPRSSSPGMRF